MLVGVAFGNDLKGDSNPEYGCAKYQTIRSNCLSTCLMALTKKFISDYMTASTISPDKIQVNSYLRATETRGVFLLIDFSRRIRL